MGSHGQGETNSKPENPRLCYNVILVEKYSLVNDL